MSVITSAPSRLSRRITLAGARRRNRTKDQWYIAHARTPIGTTFGVGLGSDDWTPGHS